MINCVSALFFTAKCISYSVALRIQNGFTWMYKQYSGMCVRIRTMTFSARRTTQIIKYVWYYYSNICVGWYSHRIWIWIKVECVQRSHERTGPKMLRSTKRTKISNKPKISYECFLELDVIILFTLYRYAFLVHLWLSFVYGKTVFIPLLKEISLTIAVYHMGNH